VHFSYTVINKKCKLLSINIVMVWVKLESDPLSRTKDLNLVTEKNRAERRDFLKECQPKYLAEISH